MRHSGGLIKVNFRGHAIFAKTCLWVTFIKGVIINYDIVPKNHLCEKKSTPTEIVELGEFCKIGGLGTIGHLVVKFVTTCVNNL